MVPPIGVALVVLAATPDAQAGSGRRSWGANALAVGEVKSCNADCRFLRVTGPADQVATVTATVSSASGTEEVKLVATGSALHGGTVLAGLPEKDALLDVSLVDGSGAPVASYVGTLATDGAVTLAEVEICDKLGCLPSVPLLAAEIIDVKGTVELLLDLADADAVVTGKVSVTDSFGTSTADVAWEPLDGVWEADLTLEHTGSVEWKVRLTDAAGGLVGGSRGRSGTSWDDGEFVIPTVGTDPNSPTYLGLIRGDEAARVKNLRTNRTVLMSEGWKMDGDLPALAMLELTDGVVVDIPVNSYQRRWDGSTLLKGDWGGSIAAGHTAQLTIGDSTMTIDGGNLLFRDLEAPLCAEGTCVMMIAEADGYSLSVTQYRWDTAFEKDLIEVELTAIDAGGKVALSEAVVAEFGDEVIAVFSQEVTLEGDVAGLAFAGDVDLVSADGTVLSDGKIDAEIARNAAGEFDLLGTRTDRIATLEPSFSILLGSEPSPCGSDDLGWISVPPLAAVAGNGSGTKAATTTTSAKPELL